MALKIIEDHTNSPIKIYDGCEPKHIFCTVKDDKGRIVCKMDLWNLWNDENADELIIEDKNELELINSLLNLPIKKDFLIDGEERIVYNIDGSDIPIPVDFVRCKENKDYIISYVLHEKSPSRYQCYILAVMEV
jgi:hypothetical protein